MTTRLDADHPFFLEIGIEPEAEPEYGVTVVGGRSYTRTATDEIMLGYLAARGLGLHVGDRMKIEERTFRIVGLYSTGVDIGDFGAMLPLVEAQAWHRRPDIVTLAFVRAQPGTDIKRLRSVIEREHPQLATVRSESEFGRVDRNLVLISAANVGGSALALFFGAAVVMNTSLLSFFERIREFGVLRAIGWSSWRILLLVLGEALVVSLVGAAVGLGAGAALVAALSRLDELRGVFHPSFTTEIFGRALAFAFGMALLGSLYPALRAARLSPLKAMRRE
jgi:putative ABC transport system permease protein